MKESNSKSQYINFATKFDRTFNNEIRTNPKFLEYQKQKSLDNLSDLRRAYFQWILDYLDKPNPIDNKRATEYYVKSRAIELEIKDDLNRRDHWNMTDIEAEKACKNKRQWEINDFLKSKDPIKLVAAPFGTGKTSFAKYASRDIITKNLLGQLEEEDAWIPIYIPLNQNINSSYRDGVDIIQDLNEIIKPDKENVLLICDGMDEYPDPSGIVSLKDRLMNIRIELDQDVSISELKILFTTRLEAGLPEKLGIRKFIRLLPFTRGQVTEFFEKYGHQDLTFKDIEKYGLQEEHSDAYYGWDLLKPLFCWMFAISFNDLQITKDVNVKISRLILYSTFIHSILEGRYKGTLIEIVKEKWILRKIAALKTIYQEVYEEDLQKHLLTFIEKDEKKKDDPLKLFIKGEQKKYQNSDKITLHTIITSYFKLNEKINNKHSIDFLHKSFQEYLLAEYYVESILYNKGFRLNIGRPSNVTIEFLSSLLAMIRDFDKKEYEKPLLRIVRSLYPDQADKKDEDLIPLLKNFKETILDNAVKIFEENKIVYIDFGCISPIEFWRENNFQNYNKHYENFMYKAISLFIIKKLDAKRNPESIFDYIKDSGNVLPYLKYFQFVDLSGADLSGADLSRADLSGATIINGADLSYANLSHTDISRANLSDADLSRANFSYAKLSNAVFYRTDLSRANLSNVDLSHADLSHTDLSHTDLSSVNLSYAKLSDAKLYGTKFSNAVFYRTDLSRVEISNVDLSGADLSGADLSGADLSGADLSRANLSSANLSSAIFSNTDLSNTSLREAIILNPKYLENVVLSKTDLSYVITDDENIFNLRSKPIFDYFIVIGSKYDLIKVLEGRLYGRLYTKDQIERIISLSKFS